MEDVLRPETGKYLGEIQNSLQHYGNSTGFFGKKMIASGPDYLTAAVLYENLIIEANSSSRTQSMPLVAIYPKEGTFWCDHPAAVVERDWVTEEHRQAGKVYLDFLLDREQQDKAMAYGFRPANLEIKLGPPFDLAHGIDPKEPQTTLEVPKANVMNAAIELWKKHKKNLDK